jgi:protein-S-isoprenylcysteine O-methyltransferase Ste14
MTAKESWGSGVWLGVRSLVWTLLVPGVVAGYVPWRYLGLDRVRLDLLDPLHLIGLGCIGLGAALLAACIWEFARYGRGTLAPVDAPRELVVQGLYRHVRNPMYLSVATIGIGELLLAQSRALLVYWTLWFIMVNLFVIAYEEPTLRRRFGLSYERYAQSVGRWLPRLGCDLPPSRESRDESNEKENQEDVEQNLGNARGGGGDPAKSERRGNQGDDQEDQGPAQHTSLREPG